MSPDWLAIARDVAILVVAVETFLLLAIFIFIAWKAYQLVRLFKAKFEELSSLGAAVLVSARQTAETAGETATTVKGSAEFVSDTLVSPVVQVVSAAAGARAFVGALFRLHSSPRDGGRT